MEVAIAAAVPRVLEIIEYTKRNLTYIVLIVGAVALLLHGGAPIPFTQWSLSTSVGFINNSPSIPLKDVNEFWDMYPVRGKIYAAWILMNPRLCMLWTWLFDHGNTVALVHQMALDNRRAAMGTVAMVGSYITADALSARLPPAVKEHLAGCLALAGSFLSRPLLAWLLWLLAPGLQMAFYAAHFVTSSPIKALYTVFFGVTMAVLEAMAAARLLRNALRGQPGMGFRAVVYFWVLPAVGSFMSLSGLFWTCLMMPSWLAHLAMVAIGFSVPPMILVPLASSIWNGNDPEAQAEFEAFIDRAGRDMLRGPPMPNARQVEPPPMPNARQVEPPPMPNAGQVEPPPMPNARRVASLISRPPLDVHWPPALEIAAEVQLLDDVPRCFICPITHSIMSEPAVAVTGASYERSAITEWLKTHSTDPLTGRRLHIRQLSPNLNMYGAIEEWMAAKVCAAGAEATAAV